MAKLAYIMGVYSSFRCMSCIMLCIEIVTFILAGIFYADPFDEDSQERALRCLRTAIIAFLITLMSIIYLPTTRSMVEILVEEAQKLEINTKSEEELREHFNVIAGYEEKEEKNETN